MPCEKDEDQLCGFTQFPAEDEIMWDYKTKKYVENKYIMIHDPVVHLIAGMWADVVLISIKEDHRKVKGKETIEYKMFTLSQLGLFLESQEWEDLPISRNDAFLLITSFHKSYNGTIASNI